MTAAATIADPNLSRIYGPDGAVRDLEWGKADSEVRMSGGKWSFTPPPPKGWEKEVPRYRATRDLLAATNPRHTGESPFSMYANGEAWQYGEQPVKAGEEIATTEWPDLSFEPLNYSARMVKTYFEQQPRTRMPNAPWQNGKVHLPEKLM